MNLKDRIGGKVVMIVKCVGLTLLLYAQEVELEPVVVTASRIPTPSGKTHL